MDVVLLGTSASLPTLYRYPVSTAVIRESEILLFDCGEGTQLQLQKARLRPGKLSRIFISHLHGDHFYGLIGLLTSLQLNGREQPLYLYGPDGLARYLEFMQDLSDFQFRYQIIIEEMAEGESRKEWDLGDYTVLALPLQHRIFTLGFRIAEKARPGKFDVEAAEKLKIPNGPLRSRLQSGETVDLPDGQKVKPEEVLGPERPGKVVAICLDSTPSKNAVILAEKSDLLIHEGTFDQSREQRAEETSHSTVVQAAEIAKQAGAKKLILTHISARYEEADDAMLLEQAQKVFAKTLIGQDLLRVAM